jgi:hypothetical protein
MRFLMQLSLESSVPEATKPPLCSLACEPSQIKYYVVYLRKRVQSRRQMLALLTTMLGALAPPTQQLLRHAHARTGAIAMMARWTSEDMKCKAMPLPLDVDSLLSADTSRKDTEVLWAALRSCFASEGEAIAAAQRNTGTILPYLNSPSNIYGSYSVLVDLLGTESARDVCAKNPGILQCNPRTLAREKAESIVSTANSVDFYEGVLGRMPPALRQNLDKVAFVLLALPIAKRLADCAGQTCGS